MASGEIPYGWTEESLNTSLLGTEPIPVEHFENPLLAKLAEMWWLDENLDLDEVTEERLEKAFDSLTPDQKLKLATMIENAAIEDPCGEHTVGVWYPPREITVDEKEIVRGIVGSLHDVKEAAVHNDAVFEWLQEGFSDAILEAAQKWKGEDYHPAIGDENDRRWARKAWQRSLATPIEGQSSLI